MVADVLPISFERLVCWSDEEIRAAEAPAYWVIEVSMARSLEDAFEIMRGVASESVGTTEARIAIIVEGWSVGVMPLIETIWKLWRIWLGPDNSYETENFPEELTELLMDWDEYEDLNLIRGKLKRETATWFEKYREEHLEICEAMRPFVLLARKD